MTKKTTAGDFSSPADPHANDVSPDLARLVAESANVDAGNPDDQPVPPPPGQEPPPADPLQEARDFFGFLRDTAAISLPYVRKIYDDGRIEQIAAAWLPLASKYGWSLGDLVGPELIFGVALLSPAPELMEAHREWKQDKKAARPPAPATPSPKPSPTNEANHTTVDWSQADAAPQAA